MTEHPGGGGPEGGWRSVGYRRAHLRARLNYAAFGGLLLAELVLLVLHVQLLILIDRVAAGQYVSEREAAGLDDALGVAGYIYLFLFVATAVTFLAWLSRSVENAPLLGAGTPDRSPREAIGWWFVPIASFWIPYQIVRDLFERLAYPGRSGREALVRVWWILFLASSWVGQIAFRLTRGADPTLDDLRMQTVAYVVSDIVDIVAIVAAIWLIYEVQARADGWAVAAGLGAPGTGWPTAVPVGQRPEVRAPAVVPSLPPRQPARLRWWPVAVGVLAIGVLVVGYVGLGQSAPASTAGPSAAPPATASAAPSGAPSTAAVPSQVTWPPPSGTSAEDYFQAGNEFAAQGRLDDAVEAFTKTIELEPTASGAYFNRANAYYDLGKFDLAVADYTKAIELDPTLQDALFNRGYAYGDLGKFDLAVADFTKAIELKPGDASAFYNRGYAYYMQGKLDLAIADFSKAIELDPALAYAYALRGAAKADGGDTAGAATDIDKALSLATDPDVISEIKRVRCSVGLGCD